MSSLKTITLAYFQVSAASDWQGAAGTQPYQLFKTPLGVIQIPIEPCNLRRNTVSFHHACRSQRVVYHLGIAADGDETNRRDGRRLFDPEGLIYG